MISLKIPENIDIILYRPVNLKCSFGSYGINMLLVIFVFVYYQLPLGSYIDINGHKPNAVQKKKKTFLKRSKTVISFKPNKNKQPQNSQMISQ